MPKSKKKNNQSGQQKQLNSQHRNEFLRKLSYSCKTVIGEDLFRLIPANELDKIFFKRARPIIAVPEQEQSIPPKIIRSIQEMIIFYTKSKYLTIESTQKEINIADLYTAGITFESYCTQLKDQDYRNAKTVKSLVLNSDLELNQLLNRIYYKLQDGAFLFLIGILNNYWARFYSFNLGAAPSKDNTGIQLVIKVKHYPPQKEKFLIDGHVRPAFRIGWTFASDQFEWLHISPAELGITSLPEDQKIPVYIQSHAIQRIFERIDCIYPNIVIFCIYESLRNCNATNERGKFIFELKILEVKVGYLVAILTEGKLLIRTFLFLTFNGTPEGKRLENYIGLKMLDTKYLKMDKLSTFMTCKLSENEELRSIFEKAGCLHLVELYDNLDQFSEVHPDHSPIEMLSRYLKTERN